MLGINYPKYCMQHSKKNCCLSETWNKLILLNNYSLFIWNSNLTSLIFYLAILVIVLSTVHELKPLKRTATWILFPLTFVKLPSYSTLEKGCMLGVQHSASFIVGIQKIFLLCKLCEDGICIHLAHYFIPRAYYNAWCSMNILLNE